MQHLAWSALERCSVQIIDSIFRKYGWAYVQSLLFDKMPDLEVTQLCP